eukprot:403338220
MRIINQKDDQALDKRSKPTKQPQTGINHIQSQIIRSSINVATKSSRNQNAHVRIIETMQPNQPIKSLHKAQSQLFSQSFINKTTGDLKLSNSILHVTPKKTQTNNQSSQLNKTPISGNNESSITSKQGFESAKGANLYVYPGVQAQMISGIYNNQCMGRGDTSQSAQGTVSVNRRYKDDISSMASNSKIMSSGKNTMMATSLELPSQSFIQANQKPQSNRVISEIVIEDAFESNYGTANSIKEQQIFSFSKTPKFGTYPILNNQTGSSKVFNQFDSVKLTEGPLFTSRSSYELNEEIFQEYNSNNDERLPRQPSNIYDYQQQYQNCYNYVDNENNILIKSNDSPNRMSLSYNLSQSQVVSNKLSIQTLQELESPRMKGNQKPLHQGFINCQRSKTPTVQSSISCFKNSFYKEINQKDIEKEQFVRPTGIIKNPFIKYRDEFARISPNNYPNQRYNSLLYKPRCETEVNDYNSKIQKQDSQDNFRHFFSQQDQQDQRMKILNSERGQDQYEKLYFQELEKHDCTKRALNKAIQLANMLIDEIHSQNNSQTFNKRTFAQPEEENRKMRDLQGYNSSSSFNISRFHTPEPLMAQNKFNTKQENRENQIVLQNQQDHEICEEDRENSRSRRELSRKKSLNASTRELQNLTNLIRKTKNSPLIANSKQSTRTRNNLTPITGLESKTYQPLSAMQSNENFSLMTSFKQLDQTTISSNMRQLLERVHNIQYKGNQENKQDSCLLDNLISENNTPNHVMQDDSFRSSNVLLPQDTQQLRSIKKITRSLFTEIQNLNQ